MRLSFQTLSCLLAAPSIVASSKWGFDDATVSVIAKKAGVGAGLKEK